MVGLALHIKCQIWVLKQNLVVCKQNRRLLIWISAQLSGVLTVPVLGLGHRSPSVSLNVQMISSQPLSSVSFQCSRTAADVARLRLRAWRMCTVKSADNGNFKRLNLIINHTHKESF